MLSILKRWNRKAPPANDRFVRVAGRTVEVQRLSMESRLLLLFYCKDFLYAVSTGAPVEAHLTQLVRLVSDTCGLAEEWLSNNTTLGELIRLYYFSDKLNGFSEAVPYLVALGWVKHG